MPYRTIAEDALARWRAAQRQMDDSEPESPTWQEAFVEAELAKADYQQAIQDATRTHNKLPVPFEQATKLEPDAEASPEGEAGPPTP